MFLPPKCLHSDDESKLPVNSNESERLEVETFNGKLHNEAFEAKKAFIQLGSWLHERCLESV